MGRYVAVAGATGSLGRSIVAELVRRGDRVLALGRDRERLGRLAGERVQTAQVDALAEGSLAGRFTEVTHVISCLGASVSPSLTAGFRGYTQVDLPANKRLADEAKRAHVQRFVYVSVANGDDPVSTRKLAYYRAHEEVVEHLASIGQEHAVVRPTGFFSVFGEFVQLARWGVIPLLGDGSARSNPVADEDVARACVEALGGPACDRVVGGPDVLTRRQIGELAFEALGKRPRFVHPPGLLFSLGAALLWPVSPRMAQLLPFVAYVSTHTLVAPVAGSLRLSDHFRALAGRG